MILRDYQQAAIDALWRYFATGGTNPLIAMPTGTGKSLVIGGFIKQALTQYPRTRVMMLTHVQELIAQNHAKLLALWPTAPSGIYSAGLARRDVAQRIIFAGIASVAKRAKEFVPPDLIIIDEAHLVSHRGDTMYRTFLDEVLAANPRCKVIGLSATCYRHGLGSLTEGGIFTDVAFDLTTLEAFNWLIEQGYLAPLHAIRASTQLNVEGVKIQGGDYVQSQLQAAVDQHDTTLSALTELNSFGKDRHRWLIFASGIQHAEHIAEIVEDQFGVSAVAIHSKLAPDERTRRMADYKAGRVRCAVSMNALTTGVDVPEIDLIGMLRPTRSTALWVQMLGRGTRPSHGKADCLVADFTNNTRDLGPINNPVLPRKPSERNVGSMGAPVRLCPSCASYVHARITICPYCGQAFTTESKLTGASSGLQVLELVNDPVVKEFAVRTVTYFVQRRRSRAPVLLVSYHCDNPSGGNIPVVYRDVICPEHEGPARRFAERWWRERCPDIPLPTDTQRACDLAIRLSEPKAVRVWINRRPPQVMSYVFH